ncbi:DUF1971 domain-containing protein [Pseudomonas sp. ABC1]|uniref:DUF1971 domain-containing protein n=1 Tax=Pseudomonas sp. ABC1 TaxID=2748080 RepID=UPI0015C2F7F8|nr:DUF1971 domain-containing protein [Pseudomonas sp. ABC1]QLF93225.1 DUF1971 domain-containing protein [Pseudomonas sp. ABC1]
MSEPDARAYPTRLPEDVRAYRRTADFDEQSLPAALRKDHATKPGVWALIHVLEGELRYCVADWGLDVVLVPGQPGIVAPQVLHFVEPRGAVRLFVEFHAAPGEGPASPH